jgi:hypothetical protein
MLELQLQALIEREEEVCVCVRDQLARSVAQSFVQTDQ